MKQIFLSIFLFSHLLIAHPHTFMEVYPTLTIKNNITEKINFKWQFDEMTSSLLIMEFDSNNNGKIDKDENQFVYENYFRTLIKQNFYTDIRVKNKVQTFPQVNNFQASIENGKICYNFSINKRYNIEDLKIDFGDKDFFVATILKKSFVKSEGFQAIVSEQDNDFYFGYRLELKKEQ